MEYFLTANNIPVHILDTKKGDNVLLLLHGYLETLYIYDDFINILSNDYRIIAIDLPGHGLSGTYKDVNTVEFNCNLIIDLLDKLNIKSVSILGHSMGGYTAAAFLELYPSRLDSIIFMNSHPYSDTQEKIEVRKKEIELIRTGKLYSIASLSIPKMFSNNNLRLYDEQIQNILELIDTHDPEGVIAVINGLIARRDKSELLKNTSKPFVFILGNEDNYITSEMILRIESDFPGKSIIIEKCGHACFIENKDATANAVKSFLEKYITRENC
jgi:pimeloyl-ACP methyl ester carboxylesterase